VSLNPALKDARFCPRCGAEAQVHYPRSLSCPACGYGAYYNPKPVAAAVPRLSDGRLWLLRRGPGDGAGRWTFPGGFVDLGESVEDAARRETMEEMRIEVELDALVGVYSRENDRVVLIVFEARALGEPSTTPEAVEVRAFAPAEVPWDELAFWSTDRALRDLLGDGPGGSRAGGGG
jgi:ADP-ribose pyrophosphatase YjhB (NUDIX family)